jgi:two-component system sensor histidine kinase KdpD
MSGHAALTRELLRKGSRIAGRLNSDWSCVWVETPDDAPDQIDATRQRHLVDNIQLAQTLGGEFVKVRGTDVAAAILDVAVARGATLVIVGPSRRRWWQHWRRPSIVQQLLHNQLGLDILVVSSATRAGP